MFRLFHWNELRYALKCLPEYIKTFRLSAPKIWCKTFCLWHYEKD